MEPELEHRLLLFPFSILQDKAERVVAIARMEQLLIALSTYQ